MTSDLSVEETRKCRKCGNRKPLAAFGNDGGYRRTTCHVCRNRRRKELALNPDLRDHTRDNDSDTHKACRECRLLKPMGEFHCRSRSKDGKNGTCKSCAIARVKAYQKARPHFDQITRYNIDFDELWCIQMGLCDACHRPMLKSGKAYTSVCVDHDHSCCPGDSSCGKCVRGLVHRNCNYVCGHAEDDPDVLDLNAAFLRRKRAHVHG